MSVRRWCVMVLSLCMSLLAPRAARAQQQENCRQQIPRNVDAGMLAPEMRSLLKRSGTFRSQCERLAAEPHVHVKLDVVYMLESGRAQTAIHRYPSGILSAEVAVLFGENYRELLGHEFEHVIEQLDGVNLRQEAAEGRAWLLPGGAFETRRAFATGVQVLREYEPLHVTAPVLTASRANGHR